MGASKKLKHTVIVPDSLFETTRFPDGQNLVKISYSEKKRLEDHICAGENKEDKKFSQPVNTLMLYQSICNFSDLQDLIMKVALLRRHWPGMFLHVCIPYLLGSRSDRSFEELGIHYMRDVISPIINSLRLDEITLVTPHSTVTESVFTATKINVVDMLPTLVHSAAYCVSTDYDESNVILVAPDIGAIKRREATEKTLDSNEQTVSTEFLTFNKSRDVSTGKINGVTVIENTVKDYNRKNFVVVDDLCDGGRTFLEVGKKLQALLKENNAKDSKLSLCVVHSIFSSKEVLETLSDIYDVIVTSDSYNSFDKNQNIQSARAKNTRIDPDRPKTNIVIDKVKHFIQSL